MLTSVLQWLAAKLAGKPKTTDLPDVETPWWWDEAAKVIARVVAVVIFLAALVVEILLAVVDVLPDPAQRWVQVAVGVCTLVAIVAARIQGLLTREHVYAFGTVADAGREALIDPHTAGGILDYPGIETVVVDAALEDAATPADDDPPATE